MIVAGSVLALLLMGLAVDGFVNPVEDDADDLPSDDGGDNEQMNESGGGDGLTDMLFADDDVSDDTSDAAQRSSSPLDFVIADEDEEDVAPAEDESRADTDWATAANTQPDSDFVEIDAVTEIDGGDEVAYVDTFDTDTDSLVLEFDGTTAETPDIEIDHNQEDGGAVVLANGIPVTLVEGAEEMTPEHVRVIMGGDEASEPQVLPETLEGVAADPQILPEVSQAGGAADPQILPEVSQADELLLERGVADDGPLTLPLPEDSEPVVSEITNTPLIDPIEDVVETISDGIPDADVLNSILDQVAGGLTDMGGTDEMLDARTGMDDAFGTGGEDAQTGTFNDDMVTGGSGQDALFGDEGDDTLAADAGNDELHGDTGNDDLRGEAGIDFLDGGEGNDTLDGGGDRDLLFGGDGDDVLYGGGANDFLQGGAGADMLNGGSGNDVLDGVFSHGTSDQDDGDVLWGGDGDDTLIVGQNDVAHGGDGADTFISGSFIETAEVAGRVEDFDPGADRIEVIFDPAETPTPTLEVQDFADGSGADIILNGEVILSVAGAQGLDPNMIDLQAMA